MRRSLQLFRQCVEPGLISDRARRAEQRKPDAGRVSVESDLVDVVQPHNHGQVAGHLGEATEDDVRAAIEQWLGALS